MLGQLHGCPTLCVRGRDVEEAERAVRFDKGTCRWSILGEAVEVARSETRTKIPTLLPEASEPLTIAEIAKPTELSRENVDKKLSRMCSAGEITTISRGLYVHPNRTDLIPSEMSEGQKGP